MISFVAGPVAALGPDHAIIEVGGFGVTVQCTPSTLATLRVGEHARLATSLVVREDSLTLYGFADDDGRRTFELLQTASGVGPRLAQAMLAVHTPEALRRAIAHQDEKALTAVPGVGRKGAQKLLVELKDRLGEPVAGPEAPGQRAAGPAPWREQVHSALVGLGYTASQADDAVSAVAPRAEAALAEGREPAVAELLRAALQSLDRGR